MAVMLILLFAAFGVGWLDASRYPNSIKSETKSSIKSTNQEPRSSMPDELIFGYPAIDVFTGILALATLLLAGIALRQLFDSRITQRAYLSVLPAGIEPWVSDSEKLACDVFIVNAGSLPATQVSWNIKCCLNRDPGFNPPKVTVGEKNTNIIAPKAKIRKSMYPPLEAERLVSFRAATKTSPFCWLYVWGHISYHDGFRESRIIDFCHRYNLLGTENLSMDGLHIGARHGQHEKGNHTNESG